MNNTYNLDEIVRARSKGISFDLVRDDLRMVLPNFPEDVLYQWVYWHNTQFIDENSFIGLEKFHFEKVNVDCEWISSVRDENLEILDYWGRDFIKGNRNKTWLGRYIYENKTWPNPIVVLDVKNSLISHEMIGRKHIVGDRFLLEGHLRLAYVRALIEKSIAAKTHDVWKVIIG